MKQLRDDIKKLHEKALRDRRDSYIDPDTGRQVMTEQYLWERGCCCGSGCRHCPYLLINVKENEKEK